MPKVTKVRSITIRTRPVQNPTGLVLADKSPINVGMVIDGALLIDPIWFRKHKDALVKAEGKIILQLDLLVKQAKQLVTTNKDVVFEVIAPHVPELRIVEMVDVEPNLKSVDEKENEDA